MQKEELLQKIRFWATAITAAFVVLIVALVVQFGFIAYNNNQLSQLRAERAAKQEQLANLQAEQEYYTHTFKDQYLLENGKKPN